MKKVFSILLISCALFTMVGCSSKKDTKGEDSSKLRVSVTSGKSQDNSNSSTKSSESNNKTADTETNKESGSKSDAAKEEKKQDRDFFGSWIVKEQIKVPGKVTSLSEEQAKAIIGEKLDIQANKFTALDGKALDNPKYNESNLDNNAFYTNYKANLDAIGVQIDSVKEITVYKDNVNEEYFNINSGSQFGIIDKDTLYVNIGGQFFKLKRI